MVPADVCASDHLERSRLGHDYLFGGNGGHRSTGLYEAARMDGASRFRQIWHITLPSIRSVIVVLLILKIGDVLELGFEHIYLLLNSMNREVAEIFDTYVYTAGLRQGQYSYSTAVGFFKSVVGLILVMSQIGYRRRQAKKAFINL